MMRPDVPNCLPMCLSVSSVGGCEEDRSHPVHLSAVALRHTHQLVYSSSYGR
jgi:hypothetical protein